MIGRSLACCTARATFTVISLSGNASDRSGASRALTGRPLDCAAGHGQRGIRTLTALPAKGARRHEFPRCTRPSPGPEPACTGRRPPGRVQSRFGYPVGLPAPHDVERDKSPAGRSGRRKVPEGPARVGREPWWRLVASRSRTSGLVSRSSVRSGPLGPAPHGIRKELLAWKEQTWKTAAT